MHLKKITTCRVCGSTALNKVIDLGPQYLQGSFVKPGKESPSSRKINCTLLRCNPEKDENACGLLQMEHSVPSSILYHAYWYRSGTNNTMRMHLKNIVDEILKLCIKKKLKVLDIGCNDGTLLKFFPAYVQKYGCDPSDVAAEVKHANIVKDVFPSPQLNKLIGKSKFDVITAIAMFYDLENPVEFVSEIKKYLSPTGIWVFEMSYMPNMLNLDSYDTICHEHLEYYSLAVIENICKRAGVKIFKIAFNDINGGSIRCYATHVENNIFDNELNQNLINLTRRKEFDMELDTDKPYMAFQKRINKLAKETHLLIKQLKQKGNRIHIYGASTKGNTILQFCNLNNSLIDYAAERNEDKFGAHTLGTNIPIISESESRKMNPNYYLVLPWHFKKEFIEREKAAILKGTKFIFPVPKVEIY